MLARMGTKMKLAVFAASLTLGFCTASELLVNRHFKGDIFSKKDCESDFCKIGGVSRSPLPLTSPQCTCQCDTLWPTFREDRNVCVDSVHECELADFVTGTSSEKIPFVYLPLSGQLVYPSASILIPSGGSELGLISPICVVSTTEVLTLGGWEDMSNLTKEYKQPFQLYNEKDKTYLQWMGKESLQKSLEGRLLLIHLLCKDTGQQSTRLFAPCISFRIAGSPGLKIIEKPEELNKSLTERDYLAIGICAGFLFMLYTFAMIVFIIIKKKQKRDKRLREQFLQLPIPQGIGYKSSRILGLEDSYLTDIAKLANEARHSQRMKNGVKCEVHNKIQGNTPCAKKQVRLSESQNIRENGASTFKVNQHLLNTHRKQVENQLQQEIATAVHCCELDNLPADSYGESMSKLNMSINGKNMVKRFFPHLEEIPEESRNNTLKDMSLTNDSLTSTESSTSSNLSSMELHEMKIGANYESNQDSSSRSNLLSMDSGIVTRSTSPTPENGSDNDESSSGHEIYSDNETVDVADSSTDDTNSDKDVNEDLQEDNQELSITKFGSHIVGCKNNLDFLSEIYNTAFSKLPKVQNSDLESDYSYYSTTSVDNDIEYDSLDFKYNGNKFPNSEEANNGPKSKYNIAEPNSIYEEISDKNHTSEIYIVSNNDMFENKTVEARNDMVRPDIKYSAGERMMISISEDNENVYSDKLLISVNENDKHDEVVNCEDSHEFDPDTLERNLDKRNELSRSELDVEDSSQEIQEVILDEPKVNIESLYTPVKKNGYSFHLRTSDERSKNNIENIFNDTSVNKLDKSSIKGPENKSGSDRIMQNHSNSSVGVIKCNTQINVQSDQTTAPILPPKRRITPKLPPKPFFSAR